MKIKWRKLRKIVNELTGEKMQIMLVSSGGLNSINAATNGTTIVLNGDHLKSDEEVIRGIAHEITHVMNPGMDCKENSFTVLWDENEAKIKNLY